MVRIELPEVLVDRKLGHLRVPDSFRKIYGTPKRYPEPKAEADLVAGASELRLTYVFPLSEMDELKTGKK